MSDILHNSFLETLLFYGVEWKRFTGNTADEMYKRLVLKVGDKPDKDAFLSKLNDVMNKKSMEKLREKRNKLLAQSDWTQMKDVILPNYNEWVKYRQELRDLPSKVELTSDALNIIFPVKPNREL